MSLCQRGCGGESLTEESHVLLAGLETLRGHSQQGGEHRPEAPVLLLAGVGRRIEGEQRDESDGQPHVH